MKNITVYISALILLIFSACTKDLPLPEVEIQAKIVVNTAFSSDQTWSVDVSKSTSVTTTEQPSALTTAKVILKDGSGNIIEELKHSENGKYISENESKPENGKSYSIEVSADGYTPALASGTVPATADVAITKVDPTTLYDEQQFKVDFEIKDKAGEKNFYLLESYTLYSDGGETYHEQNEITFLDVNGDNGELGDATDSFTRIYLPGNSFDGQTYKTQATIYSYIPEGTNPELYDLFFVVKSVDESLYNYYKSFDRFKLSNDAPFIEPVQVFTNVENGLGVFGGFSEKQLKIE